MKRWRHSRLYCWLGLAFPAPRQRDTLDADSADIDALSADMEDV
jgi:hypothetical protein